MESSGADISPPQVQCAHHRSASRARFFKLGIWLLDLGDVREVARVRLNGCDIATAWSLRFEVRLGDFLKPGSNVLKEAFHARALAC